MTTVSHRRWPLWLQAISFAVVAVAGGYWLGGAFALERTDAALAVPTLLAFALLYLGMAERNGYKATTAALGAALAATATLLIVVGLLANSSAWREGLWSLTYVAVTAAALMIAALVVRWSTALGRMLRWSVFLAVALLWWLGAHVALGRAYWPTVQAETGRAIVVTGLPLVRWAVPGKAVAMQEDTALATLRAISSRPITLADSLFSGMLKSDDRLLLAHPQALPPEALVEIDRFVRAGGRAVVLADGLSGWPPPHGFGDPRNPPVTSLLTPLLDYWGLSLAAPVPGQAEAEAVTVRHMGYRLMLHSAGHFDRLPRDCRGTGKNSSGQTMIAICRIGKGTVTLIADADLLYAPLWGSEPRWARHLRPSDNMEWVAQQLNAPQRPHVWGLRPTRWN